MIKRISSVKKQQGLTLIELMISMLIGSIVMLVAAQLVVTTCSSKRLLNAEAELQENARFGLSVINSIVQRAGGFGCRTSQEANTNSLLDFTDASFTPWQVIEGWEAINSTYGEPYVANLNAVVSEVTNGQWKTSAGAVIEDGISSVVGSDVLKLWYTEGSGSSLNSITGGVLSFSSMDLEQGDVIVVNDCKTVTFAQVCSCDSEDSTVCAGDDLMANINAGSCVNPGNIAHAFNDLNISTAEIGILQQALLFVSKPNGSADGIPTLYMARMGSNGKHGDPEEVLNYVESLQVLFGEDTTSDNSPNYYVGGDSVDDWNNVVSVKISLLLRSKENYVLPESQKIIFNGAPVELATTDRHLRRVYSSTISLRNRNIGY